MDLHRSTQVACALLPPTAELLERYTKAWPDSGRRGRPARPTLINVERAFHVRFARVFGGWSDSEIVGRMTPEIDPPSDATPRQLRRRAREIVDRLEEPARALEAAEGLEPARSDRDGDLRRASTYAHRRWLTARKAVARKYHLLLSESARSPTSASGHPPQVLVASALRCLRAELELLAHFEAWCRAEDAVSPPIDQVGNRASYQHIEAACAERSRLINDLESAVRDASASAARRKFTTTTSLAALDHRHTERTDAYLGHTPIAQRADMTAALAELDADEQASMQRDVLGRLTLEWDPAAADDDGLDE